MDFKEINKHFKQVNEDISGMNKEIKQHQKEDKQNLNDSTLTLLKLMSEDMRDHDASEQSIQLAIKGTYEFYKVVTKAQLPQSSLNSLLHHENQAQQRYILKEIVEKTGLNYKTLRMTLSRMH